MSQTIDLHNAVGLIHQERVQTDDERAIPFFFLAGSGVSHPPLPLASEIVEYCRSEARKFNHVDEPPGLAPIDQYSYWFQRAYPAPAARQRYLRRLIVDKPISEATLRLAHLLSSRTIANIVITPNFDDFVSRALTLFGVQHIVCDHSATTERIDPENTRDVQVVHVHGSYWFYDCCNLVDEIHARARQSNESNSTMAFLLDDILRAHAPIVLGYSGWESDVIMSALRRRLRSTLPHNLYWFLYRRAELDTLPVWLREHPNVYFVAQQSIPRELASVRGDAESDALPAKVVLDALIRQLGVPAPLLTRDPLEYLAEYLKRSWYAGDPTRGTGSPDIYAIKSVIARVEAARKTEAGANSPTLADSYIALESARDAVRRSKYAEAMELALAVDHSTLPPGGLFDLVEVLQTATIHGDNLAQEVPAYQKIMELAGEIMRSDHPDREKVIPADAMAHALCVAALTTTDPDAAISLADETRSKFNDDADLRLYVADALLGKGFSLHRKGRYAEAATVYQDVIATLRPDLAHLDDALRQRLLRAYVWRAADLNASEAYDDAVAALNELDGSPELRAADPVLYGEGLLHRASAEWARGAKSRALSAAVQLIETYRDRRAGLESEIVHAGILAARAGAELEDLTAIMTGCNAAIDVIEAGYAADAALLEDVYLRRGTAFEKLGDVDHARRDFERLLSVASTEEAKTLATESLARLQIPPPN